MGLQGCVCNFYFLGAALYKFPAQGGSGCFACVRSWPVLCFTASELDTSTVFNKKKITPPGRPYVVVAH